MTETQAPQADSIEGLIDRLRDHVGGGGEVAMVLSPNPGGYRLGLAFGTHADAVSGPHYITRVLRALAHAAGKT